MQLLGLDYFVFEDIARIVLELGFLVQLYFGGLFKYILTVTDASLPSGRSYG